MSNFYTRGHFEHYSTTADNFNGCKFFFCKKKKNLQNNLALFHNFVEYQINYYTRGHFQHYNSADNFNGCTFFFRKKKKNLQNNLAFISQLCRISN